MNPIRAEETGTGQGVPVRPASEDVAARLRMAESNHDRLLAWTSRYDARTTPILALDTAIMGYLAALAPPVAEWTVAFVLTAGVSALCIAASLWCLYAGSFPRTRTKHPSLVFFKTIGELEQDDFVRRFRARDAEEHLTDVLRQSHEVSALLNLKFGYLRRAFVLLLAAIPFWLAAIVLVLRPF